MSEAPEKIALYDMDGTLADYDSTVARELTKMAAPGEPLVYDHSDDETPWMAARRAAITRDPAFWVNLPRFKLGFDLWEVTQKIGFLHMIATKGPRTKSTAWQGKVDWVSREIGEDVPMTITTDKGLLYGRVLVDDWPSYMLRWLSKRPRGLGVMPAQPWNVTFKHPQVIRYDGTNLPEVRERLEAAFAR